VTILNLVSLLELPARLGYNWRGDILFMHCGSHEGSLVGLSTALNGFAVASRRGWISRRMGIFRENLPRWRFLRQNLPRWGFSEKIYHGGDFYDKIYHGGDFS